MSDRTYAEPPPTENHARLRRARERARAAADRVQHLNTLSAPPRAQAAALAADRARDECWRWNLDAAGRYPPDLQEAHAELAERLADMAEKAIEAEGRARR